MIIIWNELLIILTAAIATIPIGTRRYFLSNAEKALDQLRPDTSRPWSGGIMGFSGKKLEEDCEIDESSIPDEIICNQIQYDERGFDQLKQAIEPHVYLKNDIRSFHLFWGDITEVVEPLCLELPSGTMTVPNALLTAQYVDGTYEQVLFHPHDPERTVKFSEILNWAREIATIRSNYVTITLVFLWIIVALQAGAIL